MDDKRKRRAALLRLGSSAAKTGKAFDRFFLPFVAGAALFTVLAATFGRQIQELVSPAKPQPAEAGPKADIIVHMLDKIPTDPYSPKWDEVPVSNIALDQQSIVKPLKLEAPKEPVRVRAAHDGESIAFLIEWSDPKPETQAIKVTEFRDACAVLITRYPAPPEARFMGTNTVTATILHWKADWQVDLDEGFQDLEKAFPNMSVDMYPLLKDSITDGKPPKTTDIPDFAKIRLPGTWVGNPVSQPSKTTPVEKLIGKGPGTITTLPTQDAAGRGVWKDGVWRVVLAKKMKASDAVQGEIEIERGATYSVAFTVWFGQSGDRGARKNPSGLLTMFVD
jgi:hypothetical protein